MSAPRGQFSSNIGFLMAAAGSAVGLGNIWGFPTKAAGNGGAAFVIVYLLLAFILAYPALMAELTIGRHARRNMVQALRGISTGPISRIFANLAGFGGIVVASLILSFYAIVAGWMVAYLADPFANFFGMSGATDWLTGNSTGRNLTFTAIFSGMTMLIIAAGVEKGIERWSTLLMPSLIILLLLLIIYVLTQPGAMTGLEVYLMPDFSHLSPKLLIAAMGQAFFSLSLGVGTMLIYGSYLSQQESLPRLGALVTLIDVGIAFTAGLLILPAMYVAQEAGTQIFSANGELIAGPDLILQVLPALFDTMGTAGLFVAIAFFALMVIASLTSSISMLEVPVSFSIENLGVRRELATPLVGLVIFTLSSLIIFNFDSLFGLIVSISTEYGQPLLGVALCVFAGWIWHRDQLLAELKKGHENIEHTLFWKIWPWYVRIVCPLLILAAFVQSLS
ncbi:sodium-dependent transporter [Microbulbifer thermotolerans]|uniref:Sodium-dependent transporter n=1 Tax=Microbulbifer thermotolerans TaxID=252514 RepID=A0AB35HZY3_MICTH|nr:sodium-dependent transporter [Microbulbifer thermotolerans]MCX2779556.1 sodium-dependent transporter [Microbulbifer thermotolerans]MCX2802921.1 sodium-dependent transporter [Microbulbifer thermotolerans]MCX2805634.1 sodium-dependent transporter [Microbulbifer thermotolerans]